MTLFDYLLLMPLVIPLLILANYINGLIPNKKLRDQFESPGDNKDKVIDFILDDEDASGGDDVDFGGD